MRPISLRLRAMKDASAKGLQVHTSERGFTEQVEGRNEWYPLDVLGSFRVVKAIRRLCQLTHRAVRVRATRFPSRDATPRIVHRVSYTQVKESQHETRRIGEACLHPVMSSMG